MNPAVSILIPVYKSERYIEKCLQSVLTQTYHNLEVIIIDDATPDNSMAIVDKITAQYPRNGMRIVHHESNKGIAATRNELLKLASGEYLFFVDSDDYIAQDAIESLVSIATQANADLVRCNYIALKNNTETAVSIPSFKDKEQLLKRHIAAWDSIEAMWQLFIRRSLITDNHISFAKGINASEDHLMMIKLYLFARIIVDAPKPVYYYRIDNELSVTHINPKAFHDSMYKGMDDAINFLKKNGVYDTYRDEVLTRTFLTKQTFLLSKENRDIDFFLDAHPECNPYYRKFNFSRSQKFLFRLADLRLRTLLKIITRFL